MTRGELEALFGSLNSSLSDIKDTVHLIEDRQASHYKSIIHLDKDVEYLKAAIVYDKQEVREKINVLDEKMKRRDKKTMWMFTLIVPTVTAFTIAAFNFLNPK